MTKFKIKNKSKSQIPNTKTKNKGSLSIEYALLIAVVIAALVGMSVYFIKALSGRWRQAADTFGSGRQYEPGKTEISH